MYDLHLYCLDNICTSAYLQVCIVEYQSSQGIPHSPSRVSKYMQHRCTGNRLQKARLGSRARVVGAGAAAGAGHRGVAAAGAAVAAGGQLHGDHQVLCEHGRGGHRVRGRPPAPQHHPQGLLLTLCCHTPSIRIILCGYCTWLWQDKPRSLHCVLFCCVRDCVQLLVYIRSSLTVSQPWLRQADASGALEAVKAAVGALPQVCRTAPCRDCARVNKSQPRMLVCVCKCCMSCIPTVSALSLVPRASLSLPTRGVVLPLDLQCVCASVCAFQASWQPCVLWASVAGIGPGLCSTKLVG